MALPDLKQIEINGTLYNIKDDVARTKADAAEQYKLDSEAWAIGERNGADVEVTDETYHNNSKYWANKSNESAQQVTTYASDSEAYAVGTRDGQDVPSTDPTYNNNAKYYSELAATTVSEKATKQDINNVYTRIEMIEAVLKGQQLAVLAIDSPKYTVRNTSGTIGIEVQSLSGNTIVYNQLAGYDGTTETVSGVTFTNNNGVWTLNGTSTASVVKSIATTGITAISGRKYLLCGNQNNLLTDPKCTLELYLNDTLVASDTNAGVIYSAQAGTLSIKIHIDSGFTFNNFIVAPQLYDITKMFETGTVPTVNEFKQMFPNMSYSNSDYTIFSTDVSRIELVGFNLFDANSQNVITGKYLDATGAEKSATGNCISDYIPVYENTDYCVCKLFSTDVARYCCWYDEDKQFISNFKYTSANLSAGKKLITSPQNARYVRLSYLASNADIVNFNYSQPDLLKTPHDGEHTEYSFVHIDIPSSLRTAYPINSVGNISDEYNFATMKYIQRVAVTDLGTKNWSKFTDAKGNTGFRNASGYLYVDTASKGLCAQYEIKAYLNPPNLADKQLMIHSKAYSSTAQIVIRDDSKSSLTAAEFKAAMNGVLLCYTLVEPVEYDISSYFPNGIKYALTSEPFSTMTLYQDDNIRLPVKFSADRYVRLEDEL